MTSNSLEKAPAPIAGDYPEWLDPYLAEVFGEDRAAEAAAMASRAPLDLRVNTLKAKREKVLASTAHLGTMETPWSPLGLRIELGADARNPGIHAEEAFIKGALEVQDEGSQLAALLSAAKPGEQVIDLCAGAGGKTLALAAMMQGKGRLIATDSDKRQLAPIHERLSRAGVHNCDVRTPKGEGDALSDIRSSADLVMIDAPCTGTGTWRRNPDAKWRIRPGALEQRLKAQGQVLDRAASLVKPGGRIAYVTCSVLAPENGGQIREFLARHRGFRSGAACGDRGRALGQGRGFRRRHAPVGRGASDDAASHGNGRVFRVGVEEAGVALPVPSRPPSPLPPRALARGGEGSGVGGHHQPASPVAASPTLNPSPPLRGGRERSAVAGGKAGLFRGACHRALIRASRNDGDSPFFKPCDAAFRRVIA